MKCLSSCLTILAVALLLAGCSPRGFLFTKATMPLDINFSQAPKGSHHGRGNVKHLHYYVDVMWSSNAIGDIARQNGMETIHYAYLETLRVLGIFNRYTVHVYGE